MNPNPIETSAVGCDAITVTRKMSDGKTVEIAIADGQAVETITTPATKDGLGASITVLKPRPLTEVELLLAGQRAV